MVTYKLTSRDIPLSESMYAMVEEQMQTLERFFDRILRFEVVLSRPHLHHRKNRFHHVRIQLKTLRNNIVIDRECEKNPRHMSFKLALQDAFHSVERRLETDVQKMRSFIKHKRRRGDLAARNDEAEEVVEIDSVELED